MKKIISLFLAGIILLSFAACSDKDKPSYKKANALVKEEKYQEAYDMLLLLPDNKKAEKLLSKFAFLTEKAEYGKTYEDYEVAVIHNYKYDQNGKMIEDVIDCAVPELAGKTTYTYDEDGKLLSSTEYDGTVVEYNSDGSILKKTSPPTDYHDDIVVIVSDYTYDENGRLLEQNDTVIDAVTGKPTESQPRRRCTYDDKGNILTDMSNTVAASYDYIYSYTFDDKGRVSTRIAKDSHNRWVKETTSYTYDDKGRLIEEETVFSDYKKMYVREYDDYGNLYKAYEAKTSDGVSMQNSMDFHKTFKLYYFPDGKIPSHASVPHATN